MILEKIKNSRVVPVIAIEEAESILPLCEALQAGGLEAAEITFRTAAAPEAIALVARHYPDFLLGAGTVTRKEEVDTAVEAGAAFAVAPGLNPSIVTYAKEKGLPFFPGVCTPSDIEKGLQLGCETLKFFPAGAAGGLPMLKALYGPYAHRGISFIPTGGITAENMNDYLSHPSVLAVGGTWIATKGQIAEGDWEGIQSRAQKARES